MSEESDAQRSFDARRDHLLHLSRSAAEDGDYEAVDEHELALAFLNEEGIGSTGSTSSTVETVLERAEVIGRDEQGNNQWQLHTSAGVYITKASSYEAKKLTPRSSGKVLLEISNNRVEGITWVVERTVKAEQ